LNAPDGPAPDGGLCDGAHPFCISGGCCDTACNDQCTQCASGTCGPEAVDKPCGLTPGYACGGNMTCPTTCSGPRDCQSPIFNCLGGSCVSTPVCNCPVGVCPGGCKPDGTCRGLCVTT